jgi:hypothetical protein
MSTEVAKVTGFDLEKLIVNGDLSKLTAEQCAEYYLLRCKQHGLDPSSQPFTYMTLQGKKVLYANKGCAEQLRCVHNVSVRISKAEQVGDLFVVIADATNGNNRVDSDVGAVNIAGLKGEALANAMMKAQTKAKRRVTLSLCGLNMLDETEVESIREQGGSANESQKQLENKSPIVVKPVIIPNPLKPEPSGAFCLECGTELVQAGSKSGYLCPKMKEPTESGRPHTQFFSNKLAEFKAMQTQSKQKVEIAPEGYPDPIDYAKLNEDWKPEIVR